eukprot:2896852-Rhodomonas_salina.3
MEIEPWRLRLRVALQVESHGPRPLLGLGICLRGTAWSPAEFITYRTTCTSTGSTTTTASGNNISVFKFSAPDS